MTVAPFWVVILIFSPGIGSTFWAEYHFRAVFERNLSPGEMIDAVIGLLESDLQ